MGRPRVIRVAGHRWRVFWTAADVQRLQDDDVLAGGATKVQWQEIAVEKLPDAPTMERVTLLHEVLHAVIAATELELDADAEEKLVRALAGPLLQVLRDNPTLVKYLLER